MSVNCTDPSKRFLNFPLLPFSLSFYVSHAYYWHFYPTRGFLYQPLLVKRAELNLNHESHLFAGLSLASHLNLWTLVFSSIKMGVILFTLWDSVSCHKNGHNNSWNRCLINSAFLSLCNLFCLPELILYYEHDLFSRLLLREKLDFIGVMRNAFFEMRGNNWLWFTFINCWFTCKAVTSWTFTDQTYRRRIWVDGKLTND